MNYEKQHDIRTHMDYPNNPRYQNKHILSHNYIFSIAITITQFLLCFVYGFLIRQPARPAQLYKTTATDYDAYNLLNTNIAPVFVVFGHFLFGVVGFGLVFSGKRKMAISGLALTLLMTILTIQWYFLFNALWTKQSNKNFTPYYSNIYLTNLQSLPIKSIKQSAYWQQQQRKRATLTEALKCALSNSIAFSSILGRAGPFQIFIVALVGTFGYQITSRFVVERIGADYGHGYRVWIFGAVLGLVMGAMLRKYHQISLGQVTKEHPNNSSSRFTISLNFIGSIIIWLFFPIFLIDPTFSLASIEQSLSQLHLTGWSVLYSMSASTITSVSISLILHGKLRVKDLLFAPIAGGIAVSSVAGYMVQPVWPILIGYVAGGLQCFINNYQQKRKDKEVVNSFTFLGLFVHAVSAAVWASIFRAALQTRSQGFVFVQNQMHNPQGQFLSALAAIGMGIAFGIICGFFISLSAKHMRMDHFRDETYWSRNDGLLILHQKQYQFQPNYNILSNICQKIQNPSPNPTPSIDNNNNKYKLSNEQVTQNSKNLITKNNAANSKLNYLGDGYKDDRIVQMRHYFNINNNLNISKK